MSRMGNTVVEIRDGAVLVDGVPDDGPAIEVLRRVTDLGRVAAVDGLPPFCGGAMGYLGYDAVRRMNETGLLLHPGAIALAVAVVSVIAKESIYQYTKHAAVKLRSNMLMANAWHSRSDAISSIVVVIGVGGAMMGYPYLDAVAAIAVAVMIAKIGIDLIRASSKELIDTALEPDVVETIRKEIIGVDGVRALHMLRSRRSGGDALVDLHLQVDPRISVSEGHQIGDTVRRRLLQRVDEVTDVTVHIDPEDDESLPTCRGLPLRAEAMDALEAAWQAVQAAPAQREVRLHYLAGKIDVELMLPLTSFVDTATTAKLQTRLAEAARELEWFGDLRIVYG